MAIEITEDLSRSHTATVKGDSAKQVGSRACSDKNCCSENTGTGIDTSGYSKNIKVLGAREPRGFNRMPLCAGICKMIKGAKRHLMNVYACFMKVLGTCLFFLAFGIEYYLSAIFVSIVVPHMYVPEVFRHFLIWLTPFILFNIQYNHIQAWYKGPGYPPTWDPLDCGLASMIHKGTIDCEVDPESKNPKLCDRCNRIRADRVHHCSVCKTCVLKMDHHCPWINNCVGWRNYQHFCLFLLYLWSYCVLGIICSSPQLYDCHFGDVIPRGYEDPHTSCEIMEFSFLLCVSVTVAVSSLFFLHLYLSLTNQTTIEHSINGDHKAEAKKRKEKWQNPYDFGYKENLHQIFGKDPIAAFLPWLRTRKGDTTYGGMCFPKKNSYQI